jgi:hypothetical protein
MRNICDRPHPSLLELNPNADPELVRIVDVLLQKDPTARGEGARSLSNHLRGFLSQRGIVDIVEHCRDFISGLSIPQNQTIVEATSSRPGTGGMSGASLMRPAFPGAGSGIRTGLPGQPIPYQTQATTGAMGPASRSPMIWIGAMLTLAILILAGAVFWSREKAQPIAGPISTKEIGVKSGLPTTSGLSKPKLDTQPLALTSSTPVALDIKPISLEANSPKTVYSTPKSTYKPPPKSTPAYTKPTPPKIPAIVTPPPEPEKQQGGQIKIKSAPPFASLTINGKSYGETPMNAWLDCPVGKVHIEIVHRLTPPFDTVIQITPGFKREFKFKLDR